MAWYLEGITCAVLDQIYNALWQSSRKTFLATSPVGLVTDQAH